MKPQYDVQLIFNETAQSRLLCGAVCSQNSSCQTFDYDSSSHRCRLFEADLTNGAIIEMASQTSLVGSVILSASLYASIYNQSCSACQENRYQTCSSTTNMCQCPGNSYWNGSMCPLQLFENATCSQINACRSDLNLSCIINYYGEFTQCLTCINLFTIFVYKNLNTDEIFHFLIRCNLDLTSSLAIHFIVLHKILLQCSREIDTSRLT
ncbi:unnamed protein product [Rotaria magnacalcarata]|uniref:Apple domain-containing protein n=3 Tax=Rotaria magnacalcarata TaxID=392030 RepID=A0A816YKH3_9BILA|nr:unnamed protein product [Rotaria magnacalcarata]